MKAYFPLLKKEGIMCGDDWNWRGGWGFHDLPVQKSVKRFAKEHGLSINVTQSGLWVLSLLNQTKGS